MTKLLCVYCASSPKIDAKYYAAAEALGRGLVAHGWGLIYGGGNLGSMGVLANAVKSAGGTVVGVIPDFMQERELAFTAADELVVVSTMRERKRIMEDRADAFVTLPGGIGTLEELSEILVSRYLNRHGKPLVLVNQDGFYDELLKFFERMTRENFKTAGLERVLRVVPDVDAVWTALKRPDGFEVDALWK
ncbi:MAG: TIGR00730 family Rossman fold protein [Verrucomicrobiota bacterium]